jgi:NAD dependent epimerase/dehydratase family enzyme
MRVVVTGATGLIGRNLVAKLVANGDSVAVLARNSSKAAKIFPPDVDIYQWDSNSDSVPLESLNDSDAIVHLIGEPIKGRWTKSKKTSNTSESRVQHQKSCNSFNNSA